MSEFFKGRQRGWYHNPGFKTGYFHTYDNLKLGDHDGHKVHVFLPHAYEKPAPNWGGAFYYNALYMNDGNTAFFPGGLGNKSWRVDDVLADLLPQRAIYPVIVVAICPNARDYEYTHDTVIGRPSGGLHKYAAYVGAVKNWVEETYHVSRGHRDHLLLGSSHGGLAAFYTACTQPQFWAAACMSSSFWVGLDSSLSGVPGLRSLEGSSLMQTCTHGLVTRRPKLYLDWGLVRSGGVHNLVIEGLAAMRGREMQRLLTARYGYKPNEELFAYEDPTGDHTEDSWHRRLPNVLKTFFQIRR